MKLPETFESLVRRKGYSELQLQKALAVYLRVHWAMYVLASVALVYAFWVFLNAGVVAAMAACTTAIGAAVHGYVYGYRAWQIRNRRLRTLWDALLDLDTYLVL